MSVPHHHLPFVDWLKTVGISLIVYGHVAAATTTTWTPPVYPKQLGVAFFVWAMGYTLAHERRTVWRVLYNRSFEVLLFGTACALLMSLIGLARSWDIAESNYLPLALGFNVFINAFPANPTTWFIGTYLHLLLLWAFLLRTTRITPWVLAGSCVLEILGRAALIEFAGGYVAYMQLLNWLTVFLMGIAMGRRSPIPRQVDRIVPILAVALVLCWPVALGYVTWKLTFPFMSPTSTGPGVATLGTSLGASFVYLVYTYAASQVAHLCPRARVVEFFAKNTLIVFIAHMPLYYGMEALLRRSVPDYALRVSIEFLVCLPGLALASEAIRTVVRPKELREGLAVWLEARLPSPISRVVRKRNVHGTW
ncbi:MAG: acyltransferase family protein [Gammaproteobacteria bacterium]